MPSKLDKTLEIMNLARFSDKISMHIITINGLLICGIKWHMEYKNISEKCDKIY